MAEKNVGSTRKRLIRGTTNDTTHEAVCTRNYGCYDTWGCLPAELRMIRHMKMSASSLVRNCTSGKLFISWPRIVHIRLPRQVDPSLGNFIRMAKYQLIYDRTLGRLALLSGSYIRKVVPQLIQDHTHQGTSHCYRHCTSGGFYISSSGIRTFSGMLYHRIEYPAV